MSGLHVQVAMTCVVCPWVGLSGGFPHTGSDARCGIGVGIFSPVNREAREGVTFERLNV